MRSPLAASSSSKGVLLMSGIMMNGKNVGTATVEREGLYYRFACKCVFDDADIHRLWVLWESGCRRLGVLVPDGRTACLNTRVPAKYIPDTQLSFQIDYHPAEHFYPVDKEKPFAHMGQLLKARFAVVDGKPGIVIK